MYSGITYTQCESQFIVTNTQEVNRANETEIAAVDELIKIKKERDDLRCKLEENKMKVIDLEIELNESSLILSEVLKISDGRELSEVKRSKSYFELQKSGKVVDRLDKRRFSRSYNDLDMVTYDRSGNDPPNVHKLSRKISDLSKEIGIKNSKIIEQQRCISILEEALRENNNITEFEQLLAVVRSKDERINELEQIINKKGTTTADYRDNRILELEDALKESFLIATEREKVFYEEEQRRIETLKKMKKMEQRIRSLQNASALNCETCTSVLKRFKQLECSLQRCKAMRDAALRQLSRVIQDILECSITEKDSQIAELEVKGVLDENETAKCDALKIERDRLLNRLKTENERILELQREEYQAHMNQEECHTRVPVDITLADDVIAVCDDNVIVWEEDIPATVL
ncbi:ERC protein 2-like [Galleria mellonella]|uniref:ERC protein 2-like n=1 Tax=Galleria mellonella TaxID=7137 RepID=A0A6J3C082_GALME|nr:ERC protein 2-like [Galleria mellonella]